MKRISKKKWNTYKNALARVNQEAAALVLEASQKNLSPKAYEVLTEQIAYEYGDAAAELACQMFEATAKAQAVKRVVAEPINRITHDGVQTILNLNKGNAEAQARGISVLVKKQASHTTMHNARKYGCEVAWIPSGDACAFCLMLASNGWRNAGKAYTGDEDVHAHNNCKCEFAVRFSNDLDVAGYSPEEAKAFYDANNGDVKAMGREMWDQNKDEINAKRRERYAERKELEQSKE